MANKNPNPPKPTPFQTIQIQDVVVSKFQHNVEVTLESLLQCILDLQSKVTGSV